VTAAATVDGDDDDDDDGVIASLFRCHHRYELWNSQQNLGTRLAQTTKDKTQCHVNDVMLSV